MKNEDTFILNASRTCLSEDNILKLKELSFQKINWDILIKKALKHSVTNLIYYSITNNSLSQLIPDKIYEKLKCEYFKTALINSIFIEEITKLSKFIEDKIILLKGADLIQNLYPNIAIRSMCDVDILVEKKDANKIWQDLQDSGFKSKAKLYVFKSKVHDRYSNQLPIHLFGLYTEKYLLEIHWNLFIKENLFFLTQRAWDTARKVKDNLYILSEEMMLVHLCFHFFRHSNESVTLRMLCDINEFILKHKETIDWTEIKTICSNNELKNKIKLTLTYAFVLLNTPVPGEFILEKILKKKRISLDKLTLGERYEDILDQYISKLKMIYRPDEMIVFLFRTFIPEKEWIIYTYKIPPEEKLWKGYLKYWKYLFIKYLLFQRIQLGH